MITKVKGQVKRFRFRVVPDPVMQSEYPDKYYKFMNEQVAKAFAIDTCGEEVSVKQL